MKGKVPKIHLLKEMRKNPKKFKKIVFLSRRNLSLLATLVAWLSSVFDVLETCFMISDVLVMFWS